MSADTGSKATRDGRRVTGIAEPENYGMSKNHERCLKGKAVSRSRDPAGGSVLRHV
jgi:hypothetical protein